MSGEQVWTSMPDELGSDRVYLDMLGQVSGLRFSSSARGGCKSLSCVLNVDPLFTHRALTPGRDVGVTVGAGDVWLGTLNAPAVGDDGTREITADGDAAQVGRFVALGLAEHNALDANDVIDAARLSGRHSRFRRVDTFPVPDGAFAGDASRMMDETLTQNANAAGKRWRVDLDRVIRYYPLSGDGARLQLRARHDIGRTMEGVLTRLDAVYIDAETGRRQAEHLDAPPADTGSTLYPAFYSPDLSTVAATHNFTLYTDGTTIVAYAIFPYAAADRISLSSPAVDLLRVEDSQFYSRFEAAGSLAVGTSGRTGTYRASSGGPSLGTGTQEGRTQRGLGSLGPTGNIAPREAVIDLTNEGAFTMQEVNTQLRSHMAKSKAQPHYEGSWTASYGDLLSLGGVPVDLATVMAGVELLVLVVDPTRNLSLGGDVELVTTGEVEYDADTGTLRLTPAESSDVPVRDRYVDPATGLAR